MEEVIRTDEELARQEIFGEKHVAPVETQEKESEGDEEQSKEEGNEASENESQEGNNEDSNDAEKASEDEEKHDESVFNPKDLKDEQFIDLMNQKFNTKFDTVEAAKGYFESQVSYRGQEDIIQKLVEKVKQSNNVLSHFSTENAYKVATLAKSDYPGREATLSKVMDSNVETLNDFDAIRLNEELKRGPNSRVDPLRFKLTKMGLRDLDMADFNEWDEADKEIVYGEAEDAKKALAELQGKVEIPKEGDGQDIEFLSEIERGVQEKKDNATKFAEVATPIAQSLVENLSKINPVEGSDFEYLIDLDTDSKKELTEFLVSEAIESNYDMRSDRDVKEMTGLLIQEIWATDGPKIAAAYAKAAEEKAWEEADKKYENWTPLGETQQRSSSEQKGAYTDNDAAQKLLNGR